MGKVGRIILGAALTFAGIVTLQPQLIAIGGTMLASSITSLFAGGTPKTQAAERQVRHPTPPRVYIDCGTRRVHGSLVLFERTASGSTVDVMAYIDGRAKAIVQAYLNDDEITISGGTVQALGDGAYGDGKVKAGFSLGLATETAFAPVVAALPGTWTSAHRGDGVVCGYLIKAPVKAKKFIETYPQGDNVFLSAAIERWWLYDPREPDQDWGDDDTWNGPTDNPVLGLLRYLVIERGEDYATRILPVIDYWTAAADICDAARALKAGGSEKMYRAWLMYDSTARPSEVIAEFLKTFDGWMGEDGDGHILIYAGELYTPTVTVDASMIVDYEVKNFVEDEDRVNEVVCTYISAEHDYSAVEASAWRDEADISARGKIVSATFEPQTPSHAQVQYLARRLAAKTNAEYSGTCSTTYAGRAIIGHRYIELTIEEAGATFYDGWAEILTIERNTQTGGVVFAWAAVSEALDDWNPATDEGDAAGVGSFVPVLPLDAPVISAATLFADDESGTDTTGARIAITVDAPDRPDLTWFARWRVQGTTIWNEREYPDIGAGASIELLTEFVPVGETIEVAVQYQIGDGRFSPWSDTETVDSAIMALTDEDGIVLTDEDDEPLIEG